MHKPWEHAEEICQLFDQPLAPSNLKEKLRKALSAAHDLQAICEKKGKRIIEPAQGNLTSDGVVKLLGPSRDFYQLQLAHFRDMPTPIPSVSHMLQKAGSIVKDAIEWVAETMSLDFEALDDSGVTSPENNSSMIILLTVDGEKVLLTADAGIPALTAAADYAETQGTTLNDLRFMQLPHHGSSHNVGPTILNRIMGKTVFVSAGEKAPKHPAKRVTNAVHRRNGVPCLTAGKAIRHSASAPVRNGWVPATPVPFYEKVEAA